MKRAILIAFVLLFNSPVFAAEAEMPVTATIIICPRDNLRQACQRESRCCYLLEEQQTDSDSPHPPRDFDGTDRPPLRMSSAWPTSR